MARIETDPNYSTPTFSRATAATDIFKKEDVQNVAAALSTHDHTTGKGLPMAAGSIPNGTITSAMIADGTIDTADLKDGAVTSAKILDGTIATGDLANNAVTNAKLGTDTARANLLTNGGFEIWQRGNGPFTTHQAYAADKWQILLSGGQTVSVTRDTANADTGSVACAAFVISGTVSAAAQAQWIQRANDAVAADNLGLRGRTVTFSMRVRASVANAVRLSLYDGSTETTGAYHSGSGAYETLTVTKTMASNMSAVLTRAYVEAAGTFYFDNAMLVVGSVAADYAPLHPADDLARCKRYYEVILQTAGELGGMGLAYSTTNATIPIRLSVEKAITPTLTSGGVAADYMVWNATGGAIALTAVPTSTVATVRIIQVAATVASGLVAGNTTSLNVVASPSGNQRLVAEANP